jgi:hypothetical protein
MKDKYMRKIIFGILFCFFVVNAMEDEIYIDARLLTKEESEIFQEYIREGRGEEIDLCAFSWIDDFNNFVEFPVKCHVFQDFIFEQPDDKDLVVDLDPDQKIDELQGYFKGDILEEEDENLCEESEDKEDVALDEYLKCLYPNCPYACISLDVLSKHLIKDHTTIKNKIYKCKHPKCLNLIFEDYHMLKGHVIHFHHQEYSQLGGCFYCQHPACVDKTGFASIEELHLHILHRHIQHSRNGRNKEGKCLWPDCGKKLKYDSLTYHIREYHLGVDLFKCKMCGQTFSKEINFLYHLAKKHNLGKYKCLKCKKAFVFLSKLKTHKCKK